MAGETTKTTALTNLHASPITKVEAKYINGILRETSDHYQFAAATSLEAGDNLITACQLPSNAVVREILIYNDDMETGGPTLVMDIGVAAAEDYISITSASATKHARDDIIDADLFVDGDTTARSATTKFTSLALDSTTFGPDDAQKAIWELLGYDDDPHTVFNVVVQSQAAAAALSSAADFAILVRYVVN